MKTKLPAQLRHQVASTRIHSVSVIFNSGFLISLSVSVFAVFLLASGEFAMGNPSRLGRAFSTASAQVNLASQTLNAAKREKAGFGQIQSSRKGTLRPLGEQCVTLRGPILTLSESSDIAGVGTAPAAFNSQADEFLISWDQLIGASWAVYDQRLAVDGTLLGENNPIITGTDIFIEPAVAYNADTNQYFVTWRFQNDPGSQGLITLLAGSWIPLVFRLETWFRSLTLGSSRRWYLTLSLASSPTMHATSLVAELQESTFGGLLAMARRSRRRHRSAPRERPLQQVKSE